jgi:repressor LexA
MLLLTPRQHAAYQFIAGFIERRGFAPSYEELRRHLGLRSLNAVAKLVTQLRRRGALAPAPLNAKRSLVPTARAIRSRSMRQVGVMDRAPATLPLLGLIAAGRPIEAIEDPEPVEVPESMLGPGERYALRVRGDSMIEDGIHDGDLIVVRRASQAENGQAVVAVIEGEATLKHFFRRGPRVELRPANQTLRPVDVPAASVEIRGILIGLLRRYS